MKRVSIVAALGLVMAGCASTPPDTTPRTPPAQPSPEQGQTQPLPPSQRQAPPQVPADRGGPSSSRQNQKQDQDDQSDTPPKEAPPQRAEAVSSPAVMSLMGRADTLAGSGHMDDAAATLERALDLEPRNAFIYQRLAAVRLAQGQADQAEQLAQKSNSVAGDNPFVEANNWKLIAEARKTAGDAKGASAASSKAVNYERSTAQYSQ